MNAGRTLLPAIKFITCFKDEVIEPMLGELILHLHFTKALKRDNIAKLCLWIIEEYNCVTDRRN